MSDAFAFVQLEFGFLLGPGDGRFLVRAAGDEAPERVLVLATLGAPERRRLRGRRGTMVRGADPEPVPTSRVTVITPEPFPDRGHGEEWLARLRAGDDPPTGRRRGDCRQPGAARAPGSPGGPVGA